MDRGARVTFKPGSKAQANWRIGEGLAGLVLARYRAPRAGLPERVDVQFSSGITVWGERISEFVEIVPEKIQ
jgi:hypothetical protein